MANKIIDWFTKGKVIFVTIAGVITFSITMYNQFKSTKTTEISGVVSSNKDIVVPVDAIVKISSPIQGQTETDSKGRFKFKIDNLKSDTFLLIIQNKKTNTETKQNEYVDAARGRNDIMVLFNSDIRDGRIYTAIGKSTSTTETQKTPAIVKMIQQFHFPKRRAHQ